MHQFCQGVIFQTALRRKKVAEKLSWCFWAEDIISFQLI